MKRPLSLGILVVLVLLASATALAAPRAQEAPPVIAQPAPDTAVRGVVQLVGTATHPQFQRYEIYYTPWPAPSDQSWVFVGDAYYTQQPLGLLGTWNSASVPDGSYALRVRVVKADGNYLDSNPLRVLVANTRPVETPTETPIDTLEPPTAEAPLEAPTAIVDVPVAEEPTPTSENAATAEPAETPLPSSEPTGEGQTGDVLSGSETTRNTAAEADNLAFSGVRLANAAKRATLYTIGAFAFVALLFGAKALLIWLWNRSRP